MLQQNFPSADSPDSLASLPSLIRGNCVESAIIAHARDAYPNEACGFVVDCGGVSLVLRATNIALDAIKDFHIPDNEVKWAEGHGRIVAVYHSHPDEEAGLTITDLTASEASGYKYLCVSYPNVAFAEHNPGAINLPYEGRQFVHGLVDCYTLVRDYYIRELGIQLRNYFREDDWWAKGQNLYLDNTANENFLLVNDLRRHDVLFFTIRSKVPNHAAIYSGDGLILHHLYGRLSGYEPLGKFIRFHSLTIRHRTLC